MASASGRRPKPLIYMNEKDWKKDGLSPACPLGWPHVANSFSPGATSGATAWCAAHHVHATWMRGCACARECTRGGLVFAWVYAWWSRGPPECYSITKGQRLERRQTIGPKRITSWSPHAPSWSPRGHLVVAPMVTSCPLVVTSWSPRGRLVVTSWSPHGNIYGDPPSLIGFFEAYAGPLWGDSGEVTRIYTSRDI